MSTEEERWAKRNHPGAELSQPPRGRGPGGVIPVVPPPPPAPRIETKPAVSVSPKRALPATGPQWLLAVAALMTSLLGGVGIQAFHGADKSQMKAIAADIRRIEQKIDDAAAKQSERENLTLHRFELTEQALCALNGGEMFDDMTCRSRTFQPLPLDRTWKGPEFETALQESWNAAGD